MVDSAMDQGPQAKMPKSEKLFPKAFLTNNEVDISKVNGDNLKQFIRACYAGMNIDFMAHASMDTSQPASHIIASSIVLNYCKMKRSAYNRTLKKLAQKEAPAIQYHYSGESRTLLFTELDNVLRSWLDLGETGFQNVHTDLTKKQTFYGEIMKYGALWELFHQRVKEIKIPPTGRVMNRANDKKPLVSLGFTQESFPYAVGLNYPFQVKSSLSQTMGPITHAWELQNWNDPSIPKASTMRTLKNMLSGYSKIGDRYVDLISGPAEEAEKKNANGLMGKILAVGGSKCTRRFAYPPIILNELSITGVDFSFSHIDPVITYNSRVALLKMDSPVENYIYKMAFTGCYFDDMGYIFTIAGANIKRSQLKKEDFGFLKEIRAGTVSEGDKVISRMAPLSKGQYVKVSGRSGQMVNNMTCSGYGTRNTSKLFEYLRRTDNVATGDLIADMRRELSDLMQTIGEERGTFSWYSFNENGKTEIPTFKCNETGEYFYN